MQSPLSAEVLPEPVCNWQAPAFGGTCYACTMAFVTSKKNVVLQLAHLGLLGRAKKKRGKGVLVFFTAIGRKTAFCVLHLSFCKAKTFRLKRS